MLLELRRLGRDERVVARVVHARGDLVDQDGPSRPLDEHLDAEHAGPVEHLHGSAGHAVGLVEDPARRARRRHRRAQYPLAVHVLDGGVRGYAAARVARGDHRHLHPKVDGPLDHDRPAAKARERAARLARRGYAAVAPPVVPVAARLEHGRAPEPAERLVELLARLDAGKVRDGDAAVAQEPLLQQLVLYDAQRGREGAHLRLALDRLQHVRVARLDLVRDDVGARRELAYGRAVAEPRHYLARPRLRGGAAGGRVQYDRPRDAPRERVRRRGRLGEHAPELPAAYDPDYRPHGGAARAV